MVPRHAYCHDESGHERLILSYRRKAGARSLRHLFREDLLARVAGDGEAVRRYRAALADVALRGAGSVLTVPADAAWLVAHDAPEPDEDFELLHSHGRALEGQVYDEAG